MWMPVTVVVVVVVVVGVVVSDDVYSTSMSLYAWTTNIIYCTTLYTKAAFSYLLIPPSLHSKKNVLLFFLLDFFWLLLFCWRISRFRIILHTRAQITIIAVHFSPRPKSRAFHLDFEIGGCSHTQTHVHSDTHQEQSETNFWTSINRFFLSAYICFAALFLHSNTFEMATSNEKLSQMSIFPTHIKRLVHVSREILFPYYLASYI